MSFRDCPTTEGSDNANHSTPARAFEATTPSVPDIKVGPTTGIPPVSPPRQHERRSSASSGAGCHTCTGTLRFDRPKKTLVATEECRRRLGELVRLILLNTVQDGPTSLASLDFVAGL